MRRTTSRLYSEESVTTRSIYDGRCSECFIDRSTAAAAATGNFKHYSRSRSTSTRDTTIFSAETHNIITTNHFHSSSFFKQQCPSRSLSVLTSRWPTTPLHPQNLEDSIPLSRGRRSPRQHRRHRPHPSHPRLTQLPLHASREGRADGVHVCCQ